jgi:hypothetical protein
MKLMHDDEYTELIINKARYILQYMNEYDAMHYLKDGGVDPGMCYLTVKAAKILIEEAVKRQRPDTVFIPEY